jgi:hypothetical protein
MVWRRVATAASALTALTGLAFAAPASPGSPGGAVDLHVACPTLDVETRALLEARARADLVAETLPKGDLTIACAAALATLIWEPTGSAIRQRAVTLPADSAGAVDVLLAGVHDLLAEWARDTAPPDAGGLDAATPPDAAPVDAPPPPIADAAVPDASEPPPPPVSSSHAAVAAIAGVDAELWQGGIEDALGAHGGARLRLAESWHASLLAGPLFGLGDADGAHAWTLRGLARVDYVILPHLELGLGIDGRVVWASSARSAAQNNTTAGLLLGARLSAPLGPVALSLSPTVEGLARPVVVDVGGTEALRLPSLLAGLSLEAAYP